MPIRIKNPASFCTQRLHESFGLPNASSQVNTLWKKKTPGMFNGQFSEDPESLGAFPTWTEIGQKRNNLMKFEKEIMVADNIFTCAYIYI
ncbi:hypothetical protein Chor_016757 [Crotalus horridus]